MKIHNNLGMLGRSKTASQKNKRTRGSKLGSRLKLLNKILFHCFSNETLVLHGFQTNVSFQKVIRKDRFRFLSGETTYEKNDCDRSRVRIKLECFCNSNANSVSFWVPASQIWVWKFTKISNGSKICSLFDFNYVENFWSQKMLHKWTLYANLIQSSFSFQT